MKQFNFLNFKNKDINKLNIGSGRRNWRGWLCYDELDFEGVTKIKFDNMKNFPLKNNSVSFFYSSHFIEHISDDVLKRILFEIKRTAAHHAILLIKIPDFCWFLEQYKYKIVESIDNKGPEYVAWSWESKNIDYTFENRLAMMFCGYWNKDYGDHFSGNINFKSKTAFHGPPKVSNHILKEIFALESPHEISKKLASEAIKDPEFKAFNHRNAWSEKELEVLFSEFNIKMIDNDRGFICNAFKEIIPDLEDAGDWSAYYLFKFC